MIKTVLITGASKGLGLAASIKLASIGYKVIGIARTDTPNYPGMLLKCDLHDAAATNNVLQQIKEQFMVDAVVNNVGVVMPEPLEEINLESLHTVYDLNVRAAVQVAQAFVSTMKANRCGRIINISSRASLGSKGLSSYSAAKCALIGLTRSWALELAEFNIAVNAIAPGFIETDLFRKQYPVGSAKYSNAIECTPLKRIGRPEEIAEAITFLLSENSGFITGQTLYIDGGRSL